MLDYRRMESAPLAPEEFDQHLANKTLRLSFVGMANCGKSYRSRTLTEEKDFLWYQVDDDIARALGLADVHEVATWMGYPASSSYPEREQRYLELEGQFTSQAAMSSHGKNLVFDTTGSVIHLASSALEALSAHTLVVHLDVGDNSLEELLQRFFKHPKPVAWSGFWSQEPGESAEEAIRRSYPALLKERLARYRALAHLTISAHELRDRSGLETLAIIREKLK